jgi:hypothetical protein
MAPIELLRLFSLHALCSPVFPPAFPLSFFAPWFPRQLSALANALPDMIHVDLLLQLTSLAATAVEKGLVERGKGGSPGQDLNTASPIAERRKLQVLLKGVTKGR